MVVVEECKGQGNGNVRVSKRMCSKGKCEYNRLVIWILMRRRPSPMSNVLVAGEGVCKKSVSKQKELTCKSSLLSVSSASSSSTYMAIFIISQDAFKTFSPE